MSSMKSQCGLLATALLLAMAGSVAAQEFRATVNGQVVDSQPGSAARRNGHCQNTGNQRIGDRHDEQGRVATRPVPPARSVHA